VKLQFSTCAYALVVVFVAEIISLYKIGVWAIGSYFPRPVGHQVVRAAL
jgi:hypothetical protein